MSNNADETCATITVSMPMRLVRQLTVAARKRGESRSRYIVKRLEAALARAVAKVPAQ